MVTRVLTTLALLAGVFVTQVVNAADWVVVPSISARSEFTSNLNYDFTSPKSDFILTLSPEADFNYSTENAQLQGHIGFKGLHYISNSNIDHIDQALAINGKYQPTARLNLSLKSAYINDSTLKEELVTSGLILSRAPRTAILVAPGITYNLTEYLLGTLSYNFNKVDYSGSSTLVNYDSQNAGLGMQYLLKNQKTTLLSNVVLGETEYVNGNLYRFVGFYPGLNHKFSENWEFNLQGGINYAQTSFTTQVVEFPVSPFFIQVRTKRLIETTVSPYVDLKTTRKWARTILTAGYLRNQNPSGAGSINEVNRIYSALVHNFTERLDASITGYYSLSSAISQPNSLGNDFLNVSPALSYHVTEKFIVNSGYRFGLRQDLTAGKSATVNVVWLMLTYSSKIGLADLIPIAPVMTPLPAAALP